MYTINDLYDLDHTLAKEWMEQYTYPWEMLKDIKMMILELGPTLEDYEEISPNVWVHPSAAIAPTAYLGAPCIIGANTEVRHCAFIRGSALVGENCVVGNSVELKNVILFDHVQTPHYNYVGDSILGYCSHMGAGSITSNVKSDKTLVVAKNGAEQIETGLKNSAPCWAIMWRLDATASSIRARSSAGTRMSILFPVSGDRCRPIPFIKTNRKRSSRKNRRIAGSIRV